MSRTNSTNVYSNSRYIVDNVSLGSPFTTVQAAINVRNNLVFCFLQVKVV